MTADRDPIDVCEGTLYLPRSITVNVFTDETGTPGSGV